MDFTNPDGMRDLYQSIYLSEDVDQLDEVSDKLARAARNTRERRYNASLGDGGMSANYSKQNAKKNMLNKTLASRAARTGSKIKPVEEEIDIYDIVLEYLCVEGYAEDLDDAEWLMANELTEEDIEEILEAQKPLPTQKMQNRRFYVNMKTGEAAGSSRNQKIDSVLQAHKKDPEGEAAKARAKSKYRG